MNAPSTSAGRPLRAALLGCGRMGLQHLRAIAAAGEAVVAGIADPAVDREAAAGLLPADALVCADPAELLARVQPDVVHVVTPPETHASLARLAIAAGCHVYVEKPFTRTRAEAEDVLALAAERGVAACAGHQQLFEPPALRLLRALPRIGTIVHVESYFSFRMVRRTITPAEQVKDVLPHAVYPVVEQLRAAAGGGGGPIAITGLDVQAAGEVRALLRLGACTGTVVVSLHARPIEQYQQVAGTNGSLRADYVTGSLVELAGPGTGAGMLLTPYRSALQVLGGATAGFARRLLARQTSYPGLREIVGRFHRSIREGTAPPVAAASILETVAVCERIGQALDAAENEAETLARKRLDAAAVPAAPASRPTVLVTGGTGLLGRRVAQELRDAGFRVRAVARRVPRYAVRVPGVEYAAHDLACPIGGELMSGVGFVAHCAAETQGGRAEHERNSVRATRHVLEAAARAGARVVHVSSLAVLKPGGPAGGELDERSPVDEGNLERGPYVWGKAESEALARQLGRERGVPVAVIRPGPLVDYDAFQPPGRLGRELGPLFVSVGHRDEPLGVCDVATAARVVRSYVEDFAAAPAVLNLVETPVPSRGQLAARLLASRPDLRIVWLPAPLLRALSPPLMLAQRLVAPGAKPIDVSSAFASERYRTELAAAVIGRCAPTS